MSGQDTSGLTYNSSPFVSPDTTGSFIQPISTRYSPTASTVCPYAIPPILGISSNDSSKKVYFIIFKNKSNFKNVILDNYITYSFVYIETFQADYDSG
jgi:hypothetical protein